MTGDAEGETAEELSRFRGGGIGLADMRSVAAGGSGEIRAIVEEECDVAGLGDRAERIDSPAPVVVVGVLEAELKRGNVAGV